MSTFAHEAILQRRYAPHLLKYPGINERRSWIQSEEGRAKASSKPTVDAFLPRAMHLEIACCSRGLTSRSVPCKSASLGISSPAKHSLLSGARPVWDVFCDDDTHLKGGGKSPPQNREYPPPIPVVIYVTPRNLDLYDKCRAPFKLSIESLNSNLGEDHD